MLVSVIIPAFNVEEWIAETLKSVLCQSHSELEIIVVDDGSTDGTANVALAVLTKGRFPFRICRQPNRGVSAARNRGWRDANGSWIQFLDSDDLLHPRKIELQITAAASSPAGDVVYSDWQKLTQQLLVWNAEDQVRTPLIGHDVLADVLKDANFLQLGSQLFRRSALERIEGFDETHSLVEDVELCLKIAMVNGIFLKAQSNGPVCWYRDRPGSLSKTDERQFVEACIRNAKLVARTIQEDHPQENSAVVDAIVDVYFGGARYFSNHDWERFGQIVDDIETLRPHFVPKAPTQLRYLSRITGYRRAERVASLYRRSKRKLLLVQ